LSVDLNAMRQTLLFNAWEAVALNTGRRNTDLKIYEFGNCYSFDEAKKEGREGNLLAPYKEVHQLGVAVTGLDIQPSWNSVAAGSSFFTLAGEVERLAARFGFDVAAMQCAPAESDLFSEAVAYRLNGKELMVMGAVAPALLARLDVKAPVWFMEMDFSHFVKAAAKVRVRAAELARFPSVRRDLALVVDKDVTFRKLREVAFATEKKLLRNVALFDVYEGDKVPEGKKSYALSFMLEDRAATLTDSAIDRVMGNLIGQFERQTGAAIRA